ncbi:hypothetical protein [Halomonas sp. KM-1]|nr:hypothetical protein [Halomonas sp. KM-1]
MRPGDRVAVLHRGRLLADEHGERLTARLGVATLGEAFDRLVGEKEAACE